MPAVTRYWWETCRPAVAANPVPNRTIRAIVDVRLVSAGVAQARRVAGQPA
jgi:hypothetical protein